MRSGSLIRLVAGLGAATLLVAACGGGEPAGGPPGGEDQAQGSIAESVDLSGQSFTVGSKEFTEQLILGQIAIQALEAAGAKASDKTGIQGTANVRKALTSGQIDLYWEYTGTGWVQHLGHEAGDAPKGSDALYQEVAQQDLEQNKVTWLEPAPLNNTYAIATANDRAEQLGVENLSDYADLVKRDPGKASLCAAAEFLTREDGWPGVEKNYGFDLPNNQVSEVDLGVIYTRVPQGEPCNFGEVFATDGRIIGNDLQIIEDNKDSFVKYNVAMTVRQNVAEKNQQLADIFNPIAEKLTTERMTQLNAKVDVEGQLPEDVAREFLVEEGFVAG